nr:vgrS protein [Salmonella sp. NCTC 7297]
MRKPPSASATRRHYGPGVIFTLTGHPVRELNRQWQVVSSVLTGKQPQALKGSRGWAPLWITSSGSSPLTGHGDRSPC